MKEKKTICGLNHKQIRYEVCPDLQQDPAALLFVQVVLARFVCQVDLPYIWYFSYPALLLINLLNAKTGSHKSHLLGYRVAGGGGGAKGIPLT